MERIAGFIPGESPPEVMTPMRLSIRIHNIENLLGSESGWVGRDED
jgi:hypothetical protein